VPVPPPGRSTQAPPTPPAPEEENEPSEPADELTEDEPSEPSEEPAEPEEEGGTEKIAPKSRTRLIRQILTTLIN